MANRRYLFGRALALLLGMLLLNACASQHSRLTQPPPLLNFQPTQAAPDVDVLALTPAMDAFLERYVLPYKNPRTRLDMLTVAVFSDGVLGFEYDETRTLSASDAFAAGAGNCIGFANLIVALARKAGLSARYQEIEHLAQFSSRSETLLLVKHINVVVSGPGFSYEIDNSGQKLDLDQPRRLVSDAYAKALYFNNLGAEWLLKHDLSRAWAYLVTAIGQNSAATDPWINLGVVYKRNSQMQAAELAYQSALKINSRNHSAMNNLYELYLQEENLQAAADLKKRVDQYRQKNPYYLMKMSEVAMDEGDYKASIDLIRRAIDKKEDDALLHFSMAKSQYFAGNQQAAEISLAQARQFAPDSQSSFYNRPLDDLMLEVSMQIEP